MACDSRWSSFGTQTVSYVKIMRLKSGALLGSAGENDAREMYALLNDIKDPRKLPSRKILADTKLDYEGIIAFPKGGVYIICTGRYEESGFQHEDDESDFGIWPATTIGGYAAAGSGSLIALGAMDAGASAKQAVIIACRRDIYCSLPVHTLHLHPAKPSRRQRR